ncbi:MAG: ABC transporter permease [Mesorhizobium sp.]
MIAVIFYFKPMFLDPVNLFSLLESAAFPGVLAIGMVFVLALREIDLSVGWMFHLSAVFAALLMAADVAPWLAALAGVLLGAGLGLINGLVAVTLRLPALVVTLGTYAMFQGLSEGLDKGQAIIPTDKSSSFFSALSGKLFGVLPVSAFVFIALALAMHVVLHRTRFGYRVQAVGSNPEAAVYAGIPTGWVRLQTLMLMGAISGLAGVMYLGFRGAIGPSEGSDFMLVAIAAVIIGGTPLSGGRGTVIGAVFGMMIVQVILSGMSFFGIDATWRTFVIGAVTVAALALDWLIKLERNRRFERSREKPRA